MYEDGMYATLRGVAYIRLLQASLTDDTTTTNGTPKPSTFDILTRLFGRPNSVDNFAVSRHKPADHLGDTLADPRKN